MNPENVIQTSKVTSPDLRDIRPKEVQRSVQVTQHKRSGITTTLTGGETTLRLQPLNNLGNNLSSPPIQRTSPTTSSRLRPSLCR